MAWWIFQNVVITAGLAAVVAVICRFTAIGPVARHALWLVVLVKFVTPPLVVWPWIAPDPLRISALDRHLVEVRDRPRLSGNSGRQTDPGDRAGAPLIGDGHVIDTNPRVDSPFVESPATLAVAAAWPWLLAVWLAGSIGLAVIEGIRLARLSRCVRKGRRADHSLQARVNTLCDRLGIRHVPVRVVSGHAPPAVWCFGRPQVLWPEDLTDAPEVSVDALLLHELAHVKRRDHAVGWIELVAGVVWWWNPLFWYVRAALREQAELACDAWVVTTLPDGRRAYAESLLVLSGAAPRGQVSMAVVGVRASTRLVLERRLAMIMQGRAPLRLTRVGLLSLAFAAALALPGWAAPQDPPPPPPPAPPAPARVQQPPPPPPPPAQAATSAPTRRARQDPPPPPPPPGWIGQTRKGQLAYWTGTDERLPADGQELLKVYQTDVEAIQREVDQKIAARRDEVIKALQALQEQHTKAGRLDQAVAIRDYLQAGQPMSPTAIYWRFKR